MSTPLLLDAMLGRLARWLRLMGYDAAYLADTDDIEVVRLARAEGRLVLTRDRGLATRRGIDAMLIDSQTLDEQLAQVAEEIGGAPEPVTPRCAVCNVPLAALSAECGAGARPAVRVALGGDVHAVPTVSPGLLAGHALAGHPGAAGGDRRGGRVRPPPPLAATLRVARRWDGSQAAHRRIRRAA